MLNMKTVTATMEMVVTAIAEMETEYVENIESTNGGDSGGNHQVDDNCYCSGNYGGNGGGQD